MSRVRDPSPAPVPSSCSGRHSACDRSTLIGPAAVPQERPRSPPQRSAALVGPRRASRRGDLRPLLDEVRGRERDLGLGSRATICMAPGSARRRRSLSGIGQIAPTGGLDRLPRPLAVLVRRPSDGVRHAHAQRVRVARNRGPAYSSPPTSRPARSEARRAPSSSARDLSAAPSSTRAPAATPSQNSTAARS